MKLARGFKNRINNCFGLALRKVHKAQQYAYRDRRIKKRTMRRTWIQNINAGVREHGVTYSRFINALNYNTNIELDRKIMAGLAHAEPYSFKAVVDEVKLQAKISDFIKRKPIIADMQAVSYTAALEKGLIKDHKDFDLERDAVMKKEDSMRFFGLRFPERDGKTKEDYMRLSFVKEDAEFLEEQKRKTLKPWEQKRLPREILADDWEEDMSMYKHKRKK